MFRGALTVFLAFAVALFGTGTGAMAQYAGAQQSYPAQYPPPAYNQNQQYPPQMQPPSGYPQQTGQYPQGNPQPAPDGQDLAADQQHGVGRISIVQGDVNLKRGDTGELIAAVANAPLLAPDHLQTSPGSRAEVELDSGNLVRLAPNTDIGFADLEYHRYQLQLGAGTICYRVLRDSNSQIEIDTPNVAVRPVSQAEIRISVLDEGTTQITVRSGQAEIFGPRGTERLDAGRTTLVRGNPSDPEFQTSYEVARDQFDDWCEGRDRDLLSSQSYQYVSRDIYGADDLDKYGNWVPSQYGQVWTPQVTSADWSPYSDGQWAWENYYGWTWVDAAPWGWAPFHYGRWFWNTGYGWCWWPGASISSVFWSPALVGFFGWGSGFGWVSLAPFEVFHPWWGRWSDGYGGFRNASLYGAYRNAGFHGGARIAGFDRFGGFRQRFAPATQAQLSNASLYQGRLPLSPTRSSYQFSNRQATANPRLASVQGRQFFQTQNFRTGGYASASGARTGFVQQNSRGVTPGIAPNAQRSYAPQSGTGATPNTSGGWQRFGEPRSLNNTQRNFSNAPESSGWHQFGTPQTSPRTYAAPNVRPQTQPNYSQQYRGNYGGQSFANQPNAQRYSAPAAPRYSAPSAQHFGGSAAPHFSAPQGGGGGHASGGGGRRR